jgi:hypothetical protein
MFGERKSAISACIVLEAHVTQAEEELEGNFSG